DPKFEISPSDGWPDAGPGRRSRLNWDREYKRPKNQVAFVFSIPVQPHRAKRGRASVAPRAEHEESRKGIEGDRLDRFDVMAGPLSSLPPARSATLFGSSSNLRIFDSSTSAVSACSSGMNSLSRMGLRRHPQLGKDRLDATARGLEPWRQHQRLAEVRRI